VSSGWSGIRVWHGHIESIQEDGNQGVPADQEDQLADAVTAEHVDGAGIG